MKTFLATLALLLIATAGFTQKSDGLIRWAMHTEITDPELKASIDETRRFVNDPDSQAKLQEYEAKKDDPKFLVTLQSDPKKKEEMELLLDSKGTLDKVSASPSAVVVKFRGANYLTTVEGGVLDKNAVLYDAGRNVSYVINHPNKTYTVVPASINNAPQRTPKITRTSETAKILGYNCTKYVIELPGRNGTVAMNYWSTTEIDIDLKALEKQSLNRGQRFIYAEIEGIPLKVETTTPFSITKIEATEYKSTTIPASDFVVPAGYSETKL
jgi:hypothetical protein